MDTKSDPEKYPRKSGADFAEGSVESVMSPPSDVHSPAGASESAPAGNMWERFRDGFKRADLSGIDTSNMSEAEIQAYLTSRAPLKRSLKARHLQMIAIGGAIGSGLFIGSGNSYQTGGPAGVLIGFGTIGIMLFFTMHALGELAVRFPVQGATAQYATRFIDKSWGFAMGWNYVMQYIVTFPLELIAAAMVINYWKGDDNGATRVNKAAWVSLFWAVSVALNLFGARGYGEGEFVFSIIKVLAVVGFIIFGIVIAAGGGPNHHYLGAHYYHDPGAFVAGAKGVFSVLVNAAFAFSGTELSGLAAAETANPVRQLPIAVKQVFWRIVLFYVVSLTIVGCLVPYTNPQLGAASDGSASPFVIAIKLAGVSGLPSVFNVVILISVLSVGNACVYASSRTIAAMGAQGFGPRWFGYIDREGRPLVGILFTAIIGLLCFLAATPKYGDVFNWMLAISGLSIVFTWGSINLAHIRFRMGMRSQGRSLDELAFKAATGIWGSFIGLGINVAIVGLQFWTALWPVNPGEKTKASARTFFEGYLSVPVIIVFYIIGKLWFKDWSLFIRAKDMDLDSGRREIDFELMQQDIELEKERRRKYGFPYKFYKFWC